MKRWSLRLRLTLFFSALLCAAWLFAAFFAWRESAGYINTFFDTQQILFAKRLATADLKNLVPALPKTKSLLKGTGKNQRGREDDDALGFAVFDAQGNLVLSDGENGPGFRFTPGDNGFVETRLADDDDVWRILWMPATDGVHRIAVGQELEYRQDMALDMLIKQLAPWALLLPVVLAGMVWLLSRELAPLRSVARGLERRNPADTSPIETNLPAEVRPLSTALNSLFERMGAMLKRERAFISDAAHELRTPLTALRVQAEVAQLAEDDPVARQKALDNLLHGIDRSARLVEQLLTLSRLEAFDARNARQSAFMGQNGLAAGPVDWQTLLTEGLSAFHKDMEKKGIEISVQAEAPPPPRQGYPALLAMLLRNLLDNACKYTPPGGKIHIGLDSRGLCIINSAPPLAEDVLQRLGTRFFRPPGQSQPGSGLGLSIAARIAELHGFTLRLKNTPEGFAAEVLFSQA